MNFKRVVITGLGIVSPVGLNTTTTWANIVAGVSGSDLITLFDTTNFKVKFACEVKDFDPSNFFDRKEANKMDRFSQFALIASDEAIINANLDFDKWPDVRMTEALIDRLTHRAEIHMMNGESYRFRQSIQVRQVRSAQASENSM